MQAQTVFVDRRAFRFAALANLALAVATGVLALSVPAAAQTVLVSGEGKGNCFNPRWSHDGKFIAFERNFSQERRIVLSIVDTLSAPMVVTVVGIQGAKPAAGAFAGFDDDAGQVCKDFSWSRGDTGKYAYSCDTATGYFSLFAAARGRLTEGKQNDGQSTWVAGDSSLVFVSSRSGEGDLYRLPLGAPPTPPVRVTSDTRATELYPVPAADGKRLAYISHAQEGDTLFVIGDVANPAQAEKITQLSGSIMHAEFAPDGSKLAFTASQKNGGRFDLFVYDFASKSLQRIVNRVEPADKHGPAWLPDSQHIVYVRSDKAKFDPLAIVDIKDPANTYDLPTQTQVNREPDLARRADGSLWLAFTAQGSVFDQKKTWRRVYMYPVKMKEAK